MAKEKAVQYNTVQYRTGTFRGKLGSNPRIILFESAVPNLITRSEAHMFQFLLPVQRQQRSDHSENQSKVAQLILRLVTNHVLLIIIIEIGSQIYSQLNLENFSCSSKNA
jgi:hypothetical protein